MEKAKKRKREKNRDVSDIEGYLGPWAKYKDEETVSKPSEEEQKELDENLAKRAKAGKQVEEKTSEEKSTLHMGDLGSKHAIYSAKFGGYHECQLFTGEGDEAAESARAYRNCVKNPRHEQFMSVSDFIDSLSCSDSEGDQHREWFRVTADLTVKLFVCYTSQDRPDGYPFCHKRGSSLPHSGTGWIHRVDSEINKLCPCDKCYGLEVRNYWRFEVSTAQHVVYDTEEAKKTRLDLFYDDETSHQDGKVVSVPALRVVWSDAEYDQCSTEYDRCYIECVTHDEKIGEMVESLYRRWDSLTKAIESRSRPFYFNTSSLSDRPREMSTRERQRYTLIISHPHGQAKKITLGKRRELKDFVLDYQTATCPGSSGAQVFDVYTEVDDAGLRHWELRHYDLSCSIHSGTRTQTQTSSVSTDQINFGHLEMF